MVMDGMSESKNEQWRELCEAVAKEHDPKKLGLLVEELIRALDKRSQSHVAPRQPDSPNRPSATK